MKRLILFSTLFFLLLLISACTQDLSQPATKAVNGEWQWIYSTGGAGGDSLAPINNTLIALSLHNDSTYVFYLNNEMQLSGNYSLRTTDNGRVLHLDHGIQVNMLSMQPDQLIITWDSSHLQLYDYNITDGFNHHFKKVN